MRQGFLTHFGVLSYRKGHFRITFDLPPRFMTQRALELSRKQTKPAKPHAQPIEYAADRIRRQFFRDHPFEALRPRTLVEREKIRDLHPVAGKQWTRLRQHGRNPSPEKFVNHNHLDIIPYHLISARIA